MKTLDYKPENFYSSDICQAIPGIREGFFYCPEMGYILEGEECILPAPYDKGTYVVYTAKVSVGEFLREWYPGLSLETYVSEELEAWIQASYRVDFNPLPELRQKGFEASYASTRGMPGGEVTLRGEKGLCAPKKIHISF